MVKLSPNLRVMCKPPKKAQGIDQRSLQVKLKKSEMFITLKCVIVFLKIKLTIFF